MNPPTAAARYSTLLWRLSSSRQWDRALQTAREWLAEDPESTQAHRAAGQAHINLHQYPQAMPHLQKVLAASPQDGFAHRLASIACTHQNLHRAADDHIQEAVRLQPNDAMHWYHLAWLRHRHGAHDAAARHARRSLELDPNDADTINLLALCERGNPAQQLARYRRALELEPENAVVHNNIGVYYLNVDRNYGRAADSFRRALTINPTDKDAQKNLTVALRKYDFVYRVLQWPDLYFSALFLNWRGWNALRMVWVIIVCISLSQFLIIGYGLWLIFGWPLYKGYEALTLRDIREQAGVPGARRGGVLRFWRWPRWVRSALFFLAYFAGWAGMFWLAADYPLERLVPFVFAVALPVIAYRVGRAAWQATHRRYVTWRGERNFRRAVETPPPLPRGA